MMPKTFLAFPLAALLWFVLAPVSARAITPIFYVGGDGSSFEKAIVIKGGNEETGVHAEYAYLQRKYPGYRRGRQALLVKKKRAYDVLDFTTAAGAKKKVYFDITDFYGKLD